MIDNVVYEKSVSECVKIGYLQQQKIQKKFQISVRSPPPSKNPVYATVVPLYSK